MMQQRGRRLRQGLLLLVALLLIGSVPIGYADDGGAIDKERLAATSQDQVSPAPSGLNDPSPAGYTVLYLFTGVANEITGGLDEATVVHCTNIGSTATSVQVQVFGPNGGSPYAGTTSLEPGHTRTFSSQSTAAYGDNVILQPSVPNLFQGSGRVLVAEHSQVICTAQLLDADVDPPTYMARLPLFNTDGYHVGAIRLRFLPLVRR